MPRNGISFQTAFAKAGGHQYAVGVFQELRHIIGIHQLTLERAHVHLAVVGRTGVYKGLQDGFIGILQLHVLAN